MNTPDPRLPSSRLKAMAQEITDLREALDTLRKAAADVIVPLRDAYIPNTAKALEAALLATENALLNAKEVRSC